MTDNIAIELHNNEFKHANTARKLFDSLTNIETIFDLSGDKNAMIEYLAAAFKGVNNRVFIGPDDIEPDEILELVPDIDEDWAKNVLNLMNHYRKSFDNEDESGMLDYVIGELNVDQNDKDDVMDLLEQIYSAETEILMRYEL